MPTEPLHVGERLSRRDLPPVLLWAQTGLDGRVVLEGARLPGRGTGRRHVGGLT